MTQNLNYLIPNFINVIYKKVEHNLRASNIYFSRFNQYCLAVLLFHLKHYRESIVGLPFSEKDESTLNRLCSVYLPAPGNEDEGEKGTILTDLCPDSFGDFGVVSKVQLLVNHFAQYEVLKKRYDQSSSLERDYNDACDKLEASRQEFNLSGRFKYNNLNAEIIPISRAGLKKLFLMNQLQQ